MNEEEKETTKEQDAAQALILNTEEISESKPAENISSEKIKKAVKKKNRRTNTRYSANIR